MNNKMDDRDAYLFMAYLAQAAAKLGFDVPLERDAYKVRSDIPAFGHQRIIEVRLGLTSEVSMPVRVFLGSPNGWRPLEEAAKDLVDNLKRLPLSIPNLVKAVLEQTAKAKQTFEGLLGRGLDVRFISLDLDLNETCSSGEPAYALSYKGLGIDARSTTSRETIGNAEALNSELEALVQEQIVRATRARERDAAKALGSIDRVLLNRAVRHGMDVATLIKSKSELEKGRIIAFPDGEVMIGWENGILTGNIPLAEGVSYFAGHIFLSPDANRSDDNVRGRPVHELINHPDLPESLLFTSDISFSKGVHSATAEVQYVLYPNDEHPTT